MPNLVKIRQTVAEIWRFFDVFFQAEDGIRDRSPSRGLGDVYKRQVMQFDPLERSNR